MVIGDPLNMVKIPIYSQLPSTSGGRLLHPQPEDAPCRGDRDPLNMAPYHNRHQNESRIRNKPQTNPQFLHVIARATEADVSLTSTSK